MRLTRYIVPGLLFLVLAAFPLVAEKPVTLDECIIIALQNHPDIQMSQEDQQKAIAGYRMAEAGDSLKVAATLNTVEYLKEGRDSNGVNIPGKDTVIGLFAGLGATYMVYKPGVAYAVDSARKGIDISKLNSKIVGDTVIFNVKKTYYQLLLANHNLELRKRMRENYSRRLETIRVLYQNGERPVLEYSMAEVSLAQASLEYERARNDVKRLRGELIAAMGLSEDTSTFAPQDLNALPELRFPLPDLLKLAETYSPQVQIARIEKDSQRINVDVARAQHNPTISVNFSAGYENSTIQTEDSYMDTLEKDRWSPTFHAGISASLPLYSGGAISSEVDMRTADYRKTILAERKLILEVHKGVKECVMQMELLREQVNISRLSIENARTNQLLAAKSYEAGIGSQLELQNAEESLLRAELGILSARYEYLTMLARMSNLIGLGEEFLCEK